MMRMRWWPNRGPAEKSGDATPRRTADIWLSASTYWYLTGLIVALGFSFGFYLV